MDSERFYFEVGVQLEPRRNLKVRDHYFIPGDWENLAVPQRPLEEDNWAGLQLIMSCWQIENGRNGNRPRLLGRFYSKNEVE